MTKQSTGSKVYGGVATFGRAMADFKAIIGTILGIIMIIAGIVLVRRQGVYTKTGTGIVKSNSCFGNPSQPTVEITKDDKGNVTGTKYRWTCTLSVVNEEDKSSNPTVKTKQISELNDNNGRVGDNIPNPIGSTIPIYINPKDPSDFDLASDDTHVIGWILIIMGPILIVGSIAWAYFATKYKIVGAYEGVRTGVDMVRGN